MKQYFCHLKRYLVGTEEKSCQSLKAETDFSIIIRGTEFCIPYFLISNSQILEATLKQINEMHHLIFLMVKTINK